MCSPACTTDPGQSLIVVLWPDSVAPRSHAINACRPSRSTSISSVSALLKSSKNPIQMKATFPLRYSATLLYGISRSEQKPRIRPLRTF